MNPGTKSAADRTDQQQQQSSGPAQLIQQMQSQQTPEARLRTLINGFCEQGRDAVNHGLPAVQTWLDSVNSDIERYVMAGR